MQPTVFHVFRIGVLVVLGLVETACQSENPAAPSPSVSFSVLDLEVGTGAEATIGSAATVNYSGWLYDAGGPDNKGTLFDSSPGQGFSFVLGLGQVIVGWDQGIVGMRVGGTRRLIIPPDMAYGSRATGLIPPNSALVFDVELLAVQ
ncbi:MAG: FKBP-type peptidyl-prolyl cis-trans isomerase [Acidobacteriota bacterium]|nr:FKBP-type peptidyl-prolyl cis-trans isomerase [Acidobacteriota bacterium]